MPQYRPKDVAQRLGVSPSTLRAWSETYKDHLSPGAQSNANQDGKYVQRRYAEEDVALLLRVKALAQGERLTAEEVKARLLAHEAPDDSPDGELLPALAHGEAPVLAHLAAVLTDLRARNESGHDATHELLARVLAAVSADADGENRRLAERLEATERELRETREALERERSKGLWDRIRGR